MLKISDIEALRDGTWQLDCPIMILTTTSIIKKVTYEGGGYIRRTVDGDLSFNLYAGQTANLEQIFCSLGEPGQLIADDVFYDLTAKDVNGREWQSNHIIPNINSCAGEKGVVLSGGLDFITHTQKCQHTSTQGSSVEFKFFDELKIPCNTSTQVTTKISGKIRKETSSLDTAQFKSCGCDFEIRNENRVVSVCAKVTNKNISPCLEIRMVESLQFVHAYPFDWVVQEKHDAETESIQIRGIDIYHNKPRIGPPIVCRSPRDSQLIWNLYDKYLSYITRYEDAQKYHPLSCFIHRVITASEGSIEAQILTLAIAIEGVLDEAFPEVPLTDISEYEKAKRVIEESCISVELKKRISGQIDAWSRNKHSATDKLLNFVEAGVLKKNEYESWKKLRNSSAHAKPLDSQNIQELLNLCHRSIMVFYKLIFHAIGYNGAYTDYGTRGWPLVQSS